MSTGLRATIPRLILLAALGAACSGHDTTATDEAEFSLRGRAKVAPSAAPMSAVPAEAAADSRALGEAPAPQPPDLAMPMPTGGAQRGDSAAASMIIRTGNASVEVDSLEPAIAAVRALAARLGGWIGNTSVSSGNDQVRSATLELKIPAARYEDALSALRPIGKVEVVSSNAEDVGEEFVDISARVANARRLEERLITLLATRTGKLEDVLAVERELARVREEIDRYEGRLRYLRTRVATSTLTVTVHEPAPLVGSTPGQSVIGEAFREMWRNFVRFVAGFIASLGTLVPLAVLLVLGLLVLRRLGFRLPARRRRTAADPTDVA